MKVSPHTFRITAAFLFCSPLVVHPGWSTPTSIDLGLAHVSFANGGKMESHARPSMRDSSEKLIPFIGGTFEVTSLLAIRLGYQYIGHLRGSSSSVDPTSPEDYLAPYTWLYDSKVRVASISPTVTFNVTAHFGISMALDANYVIAHQRRWIVDRNWTFVSTTRIPYDGTKSRWTPGVAACINYKINKWSNTQIGYRYVYLRPTWKLKADEVFLAVSFSRESFFKNSTVQTPNKSPEPTPTAVTPRATDPNSK